MIPNKSSSFFKNTVSGFDKGGIWAEKISAGSFIERNRIDDNSQNGISVKSTQAITVNGNYISRSSKSGIMIQRCSTANIVDNFTSANGTNGIEVSEKSDKSNIAGNICGANKKNVLYLTETAGVFIDENIFRNNKKYAAWLKDSHIESYNANSFEDNGHSDRIYTKKTEMPEQMKEAK